MLTIGISRGLVFLQSTAWGARQTWGGGEEAQGGGGALHGRAAASAGGEGGAGGKPASAETGEQCFMGNRDHLSQSLKVTRHRQTKGHYLESPAVQICDVPWALICCSSHRAHLTPSLCSGQIWSCRTGLMGQSVALWTYKAHLWCLSSIKKVFLKN